MPRAYQDKYAGILRVAIYLRKSRADEELEKELGKGETLARHRKALMRIIKENNLSLVEVYEELESGESIIHRPAMLELLRAVETGAYDAVLVIDIHRLGRGDQQDQGLIIKTFKESKTKIVTPDRIYDLNDDYDEEYVENESFMGRKEYKYIRRRLQGGRVRSVEEGNYIATLPPYGYTIHKEKRTRTLRPHPDQAPVVKMIFDMYVNQGLGCAKIANELNSLGIKSYTGKRWERTAITAIIKNQIYEGKVVWKKKSIKKSNTPGKKKDTYTRDQKDWIVAEGKHPPLIDEVTFRRAQDIILTKYHVPYQVVNGIQNPLAGIIVCGKCGYMMHRRPYQHGLPHLLCEVCDNKSVRLEYVEQKLLKSIEIWLEDLTVKTNSGKVKKENPSIIALQKKLSALEKDLQELQVQKLNLHDLLERGVYTVETFIERSKNIADRSDEIKNSLDNVSAAIAKENRLLKTKHDIIPSLKNVIDAYYKTDDIVKKNQLLKSIIEKAEYIKNKDQKNDNFTLKIYPKVLEMPG
jgi:site-specific DNA recombinase